MPPSKVTAACPLYVLFIFRERLILLQEPHPWPRLPWELRPQVLRVLHFQKIDWQASLVTVAALLVTILCRRWNLL